MTSNKIIKQLRDCTGVGLIDCKKALDAGSGGLIFPMIESKEQLIKAISV